MEQAPVVYGKYQLLELLARGGMAEVFKAKSHGVEGFEKILVIKRILGELSENPQFVEMFVNEAKIAVTLSHANIVQVFDLGRADDTYFIAMEFVAGADLATVLRRARKYDKPLPPELAVFIVSEVAKGLDYAHRRRDADMKPLNIVHRDVSPQNVLLSYEGEVKLTDFGIAKARTTVAEGTEHGVLKGKYAYMAPEQAKGQSVSAKTDIFALGIVLYEALAGTNPFLQSATYETLQRVRDGSVEPIRELNPDVPEELAAIVHKAMAPAPEDRYKNAGRFYEELIQFLYGAGRRVGAHDLSNYLDALRAASEGRRSKTNTVEGLRATFDLDTAVGRPGVDLTPAEVPSAREGSRVTTGSGRTATPVTKPQAERRDVTALALSVSPSATIDQLITRGGGEIVVEKDDVVVALFGKVSPDGRDTEHAARAALMAIGAIDTLQAAVHSGRVLIDPTGKLVEDEAYALLVGEAEALLADAGGRPIVSEIAYDGLRRFFDLRAREGNNYELLGERNLTEALGRFVGRKKELRRIGEVLAIASRGKQCLVSLVGEAGVGKTRLLLETMRRLRLGGHDVGMYVCRTPRHSRDIPLSSTQEMLRVILGIEEFDTEADVREKVQRLRELGLHRAELDAVTTTLGLSMSKETPVDGKRPLFAAIARIALKLAEDRLTVFAFDDFDGVDDESLEILQGLIQRPGASRIIIIVSHRPDHRTRWDDLPNHHGLDLGPLEDEDVARLTGARLGADEVPAKLLREVGIKSGGNPLYVEEYIQALLDAGAIQAADGKVTFRPEVAAVEVPKTLRGIVAQRLSRLTQRERHLLQIAAIVGGRFHDVLVAHIAEDPGPVVSAALEALVERGILSRTAPREYGFSHGLIPEVVKSGLTLDARRELHSAVGRSLEELYPEHLDDLAERLAFHYREAGRQARAIDFLVRAADRLESRHKLVGAIGYLVRALELLGKAATPDRDRSLQLYRRVGDLCLRSRELEEGVEQMDAALELAEGLGRDEYVARFSLMKGDSLALLQRLDEAQQWFERAQQVAKAVGNRDLLRDITAAHAEAHARNGEYGRATVLLRQALSLARDANDKAAELRCVLPLAHACAGFGDKKGALESLAEARKLMGDNPERIDECMVWKTESLVGYYTGDIERALKAGYKGLELAKQYGFAYEAAINAHNLGELHLREGDFKRAFAMLRYSYDVAKDNGFVKLQYGNLRVLGFIDAIKLGSEEGRERVQEAYEFARRHGYVWDVVQAQHMLGIIDHQLGKHDDAKRRFREVLQLSAQYGMSHYETTASEALEAIEAGQPVPLPR